MNVNTDTVFGVFFAGSAVTSAMVLAAEALTARADRRRAAEPQPSLVVSVTIAAQGTEAQRERADV
ncbi:hypothetical protein [Kitasatospora phosalacinea]|uniref:Uncharacterized protein n=1 Tax=Kitasatospora phosalacinea TaxID=2065 RepID=A0A9W6PNM1_9ACTN|nr:hypothetical protein [Kitasatospora phosalacinea]GLW58096.1 hypothetical protein Kpho01_61070 [Kitasatospora phosalacinea]